MNPRRETIRRLERNGYQLKRKGANHDIYYNPQTKLTIPVKRHVLTKTTRATSSRKPVY